MPVATTRWACYGALAALAAWVWWGRVRDLEFEYAAYGISPMAFVYKQSEPENFARDFPGGVEQLGRSAPMLVYPLAWRFLGVPPERVYPVFVAFEIAFMAVVMLLLARTLRPDAPPAVGALVAALVLASSARNMNLAAFRQPFFWGLFYNVADGLRLLALVAALRGRALLAGALLAGAFASHPAMGLMGAVFVAAVALAGRKDFLPGVANGRSVARRVPRATCHGEGDGEQWASSFVPRSRSWLRPAIGNWRPRVALLSGAAVFISLAALWTAGVVGVGRLAGAEFPKSLWFGLTRLMSYHWYPVDNGFFTTGHRAGFLPFLSFLILLATYMGGASRPGSRERQVAWGMGVALVLTLLGVAFSVVELSPALVKLALHRANDLVVTVGLPFVVAGLWADVGSGRLSRAVLAGLLLASPFLGPPGFPLALSVALVGVQWVDRQCWAGTPRPRAALLLAGVGVMLMVVYAASGLLGPLDSAAYAGWSWVSQPPVLAGVGALVAATLTGRWTRAVLAAGLACAAVAWVQGSRLSEGQLAWARDYRDAQRWARGSTPRDALFMLDPALGHPAFVQGWRDYARRSSFGVLREWLYTSWFYTSDHAACQEGLKRAGELGLDVWQFLDWRPPLKGFMALSLAARKAYYEADDAWRLSLARRYGIAYFVFEKQAGAPRTALRPAFENASFLILAAPTTVHQ